MSKDHVIVMTQNLDSFEQSLVLDLDETQEDEFCYRGYFTDKDSNDNVVLKEFDKGSDEITRDISSINSFFTALTSFITEKPSFEIVSTITDCEVLLIAREDLNFLYNI